MNEKWDFDRAGFVQSQEGRQMGDVIAVYSYLMERCGDAGARHFS